MADGYLRLENRHTGEVLLLRRTRNSAGQTVLRIDGSLPPRSEGPPLHIHFAEREEVSVKAGTVGARIGNQNVVVKAGGNAVFPAGVPHRWWNAGDDLLELSGRAVPVVDLDRYLQAVFAVVNSSLTGRPSIFYMAHALWRYRRTQTMASPPAAIQRILFPLILLVGRILGKYKGDRWPGCPESCAGAPMTETTTA